MIGRILCILGLHAWEDDELQCGQWRFQLCARTDCDAERVIERESFYDAR